MTRRISMPLHYCQPYLHPQFSGPIYQANKRNLGGPTLGLRCKLLLSGWPECAIFSYPCNFHRDSETDSTGTVKNDLIPFYLLDCSWNDVFSFLSSVPKLCRPVPENGNRWGYQRGDDPMPALRPRLSGQILGQSRDLRRTGSVSPSWPWEI